MRDYLVFVRAGAASLHRRCIEEDPRRNWDCCVSWYTEQPPAESLAELYDHRGANKYDAFVETFHDVLTSTPYRYVLLLDDDVKFRPGDISRFFDICNRERLDLCQPALAWGTHATFDVTLWNPACSVRQVGFVEVMAPCFSRATLEELLPTFRLTRSTWGIDHAWGSLLAGQNRIAIVDAVRVHHTKPVDLENGPFYRLMRSLGVDPHADMSEVLERYPYVQHGTLDVLHRYRWRLPQRLNRALMWLFEKHKKHWHRARYRSQHAPARASPLLSQ